MNTEFWKGRSVLVTGATGLLGGWLVKELLKLSAEVVVLIRDGLPNNMLVREGLVNSVVTVRGSLQDKSLLQRTMSEYSISTIFHLAAQSIVIVARADPVGTLEANVQGTWNLLEAARQSSVRQVIVASSDKAYGIGAQLPYLETHPLQGRFPYEVSKSCTDLIAQMYATSYGLPVAITRCSNLFGGGDLNFARIIPNLIHCALRGKRVVIPNGGQAMREFLYIKDAVAAYLCLAEHMAEDKLLEGEAFNFGLGTPVNILDLAHQVLKLMRCSHLQPIVEPGSTLEILMQYSSSEKALRLLGWAPQYSLEEGLLETITWYKTFLETYEEKNKPSLA